MLLNQVKRQFYASNEQKLNVEGKEFGILLPSGILRNSTIDCHFQCHPSPSIFTVSPKLCVVAESNLHPLRPPKVRTFGPTNSTQRMWHCPWQLSLIFKKKNSWILKTINVDLSNLGLVFSWKKNSPIVCRAHARKMVNLNLPSSESACDPSGMYRCCTTDAFIRFLIFVFENALQIRNQWFILIWALLAVHHLQSRHTRLRPTWHRVHFNSVPLCLTLAVGHWQIGRILPTFVFRIYAKTVHIFNINWPAPKIRIMGIQVVHFIVELSDQNIWPS